MSVDATSDEIAAAIRQAAVGVMAATIYAARLEMANLKGNGWSASPLADTVAEAVELHRMVTAALEQPFTPIQPPSAP
jgi:hypothetical protein